MENVGSKEVQKLVGDIVYWKCEECSCTGKARLNNWNSPRARTCCGGRFYRNRDRLLIVWTDMKSRCLDPNHPAYNRYKQFGAPTWKSYEEFSQWALSNGWAYGLELDRVDNGKGYKPSNCRFVTRKVNLRNKQSNRILTAFGESKTLADWADDERCSIQAQSIAARIDRYGWDVEKAISQPGR